MSRAKDLIMGNDEKNRIEKPSITESALIVIPLPAVFNAVTAASLYSLPEAISLFILQNIWMVKSTPSPIETEESSAVTISSFIPLHPIKPNVQITAKRSGREPRSPAYILLKIIARSMNIATKANKRE